MKIICSKGHAMQESGYIGSYKIYTCDCNNSGILVQADTAIKEGKKGAKI